VRWLRVAEDTAGRAWAAAVLHTAMRWDADNAEAIMGLDALEQRGEWKPYGRSQLRPTG